MVRVFGVRAAESARRKANWKTWQPHRTDGWILNPILYWTDEDVWQFTRHENLPYCSLYDEGFKRLGCIGCPMSNRREAFNRWPKYESAWQRATERFYNRLHGTLKEDGTPRNVNRFKKWQDLWKWWMEELPETDDNDCQMGLF